MSKIHCYLQIAGEVICEIFLQFPEARWKIGESTIRQRMKRWLAYLREKSSMPMIRKRGNRRQCNNDSESEGRIYSAPELLCNPKIVSSLKQQTLQCAVQLYPPMEGKLYDNFRCSAEESSYNPPTKHFQRKFSKEDRLESESRCQSPFRELPAQIKASRGGTTWKRKVPSDTPALDTLSFFNPTVPLKESQQLSFEAQAQMDLKKVQGLQAAIQAYKKRSSYLCRLGLHWTPFRLNVITSG